MAPEARENLVNMVQHWMMQPTASGESMADWPLERRNEMWEALTQFDEKYGESLRLPSARARMLERWKAMMENDRARGAGELR